MSKTFRNSVREEEADHRREGQKNRAATWSKRNDDARKNRREVRDELRKYVDC